VSTIAECSVFDDVDVMRIVEELVTFGREALAGGLLASSCGNASIRVGAHMLVTASGSAVGRLRYDEVSVVRLGDGLTVCGPKPSVEMDFHRRAYLVRPSVGAVLHGQSRYATLLACMVDPPTNLDLIPEVPAYVLKHAYTAYARPGSQELADGVIERLLDPDVTIVQMVNHGQVVVGADWRAVIRRAQFFETACFIAASGAELQTIPADEAKVLREYGRRS
jgi:ribulose-5-phosphate 4-epimerase/fuculose-1-phosphate aldolase